MLHLGAFGSLRNASHLEQRKITVHTTYVTSLTWSQCAHRYALFLSDYAIKGWLMRTMLFSSICTGLTTDFMLISLRLGRWHSVTRVMIRFSNYTVTCIAVLAAKLLMLALRLLSLSSLQNLCVIEIRPALSQTAMFGQILVTILVQT